MRSPLIDEIAARLFHPFLPAGRLPGHDSLSRSQYCRGLSGSAMRLDRPTATGSTIQSGEGLFHVGALDYAKSARRRDVAPRCGAQRLRRCLCQKARSVYRLRDVVVHQRPQVRPVRSAIVAPVPCSRRIPGNSFPRFQPRDRSTFQPRGLPIDRRDPRSRKNAK